MRSSGPFLIMSCEAISAIVGTARLRSSILTRHDQSQIETSTTTIYRQKDTAFPPDLPPPTSRLPSALYDRHAC